MRVAASVILYHSRRSLEEVISSYVHLVERVYVIDNTETVYNKNKSVGSNICFIHDGLNEGIAKRLNQACNLAIKEGFAFLLTMDQDSTFENLSLKNYLNCVESFTNKESVSMFGINYYQLKQDQHNCVWSDADFLITSGSIINLNAYIKIGNFNEDLFIDLVDFDYCFQSIKKSFRIVKFSQIYMYHQLGKSEQKISLLNLKKTSRSFHSPSRLYYMYRNYLYIKTIHGDRFGDVLEVFKKDLFIRIKNNLLYTKYQVKTLKMLFKARKDFSQKKMGKQL
jgi:rhamnosyltransferase